MKPKTITRLMFVLVLTAQLCCKEKQVLPPEKQLPPVTLPAMTECHQKNSWDSLNIHDKLLGQWDWEYIQCFWDPEKGNYKDFLGMTVEFKSDNTLEVKMNGQTTQSSTWKIANMGDGYFKVDTNPLVVQLPGRILFCDDRVLFNDSYVDGCDNYFKKKL